MDEHHISFLLLSVELLQPHGLQISLLLHFKINFILYELYQFGHKVQSSLSTTKHNILFSDGASIIISKLFEPWNIVQNYENIVVRYLIKHYNLLLFKQNMK